MNSEFVLADLTARSIHVRNQPVEIRCLEGELLVTMEGDPGDHVLAPGGTFRVTGRGRLAVMALGDSRLRVAEELPATTGARAAPDAAARGLAPRWLALGLSAMPFTRSGRWRRSGARAPRGAACRG